ncbi:MAG TPA: Hsp20/alpha crystallin family protein [Verrucomicrobiae bacterium]|jgi:HSP20 family protein|nr:Hsp20/alpha crystallin family protein [Verrucomicrobiae bacterium]
MKLTRVSTWPTLGRLTDLRDEIDRLFEAPLARTAEFLGWTPAFDVYEEKDNYVVKAELPGMKREEINVSIQGRDLVISGERKSETKSQESEVHRAERYFGKFQRAVSLPVAVSAQGVQAEYKDGVLTVTLPKSEESKAKQIEVKVS